MEEAAESDRSEKKEKKKSWIPREKLRRKIQANNEREKQIYEMRMKACMNPKNIVKPKRPVEKLSQKGPSLAERIIKHKEMIEIREKQLKIEMYNHIEDLERKVDFLLQQLVGNNDPNEPQIDPEIWTMFTSEQFQQEIDIFLHCQIEDNHEDY